MEYIDDKTRIAELEDSLADALATIEELTAELKEARSLLKSTQWYESQQRQHLERFARIKEIIDPWLESNGQMTILIFYTHKQLILHRRCVSIAGFPNAHRDSGENRRPRRRVKHSSLSWMKSPTPVPANGCSVVAAVRTLLSVC